jgi:ABC-type multidrug transport system ATPase subunit
MIKEPWGIINKTKIATILNDYISKLNIKLGSLSDPVSSSSGGNQQKTVLARWLAINPKILILDEPTHGVDVGAKLEIYKLMRTLTENGISIILISSELPEIILMSDRVVVMREGNIKAILDQDQLTEENIMTYAVFNNSDLQTDNSSNLLGKNGQNAGLGIGHASKDETSIMLHLHPELVDLHELPDISQKIFYRDWAIVDGPAFAKNPTADYSIRPADDPRQATAEHGHSFLDANIKILAAEIRQFLWQNNIVTKDESKTAVR